MSFYINIFSLLTIPWLIIQIYYSYPFARLTFGLTSKDTFYKNYIALYEDYKILDKILPTNAKILTVGRRLNAFYSPRPIFMSLSDLEKLPGPKYLLVVGAKYDFSNLKLKKGNIIYKNNEAVIFTYRTPGKKPSYGEINVYEIIE